MAEVEVVARYRAIEMWLRGRIEQGREGDLLPPETELASQFSVSRMTARRAMENLAAEGLVQRRRGLGTFITARPVHRHAGPLMSFTADMQRKGLTARSRLLSAELRPAGAAVQEALNLDGAWVVAIDRLRLGNGVPMAVEHVHLTTDCAAVLASDLETGSLHEALRLIGRIPSMARARITARSATAAESDLLEIGPRSPVLVETRVITDRDDHPLEYTTTVYQPERYVIDAVFSLEPSTTHEPRRRSRDSFA